MAIELPEELKPVVETVPAGTRENGLMVGATSQPVLPAPAANADLMDTAAPDVQPTYSPGSLADKISAAYLTHLAQNQPQKPQQQQPPSTGQKVVNVAAGAMSALGDAAHASDTKGGWLTGVANTLNARNQRIAGEQERAFNQSEQLKRDEELHAKNQSEAILMHRNIYRQDAAIREEGYKGNKDFVDTFRENHAVEDNVNHAELAKRMQDPKFADDHYVRATQDEPVLDANGEQKKDEFGNPITSPLYAVVTRATKDGLPDDKTVSPEMAASMGKYLGQSMPANTKLTATQYAALDGQINLARNAVNILNSTNEKELSAEQLKSLSPYLTDPMIQSAVSHVPGSAYAGLLQFQKNADDHITALTQQAQAAKAAGNQQALTAAQQQIADITAEKQKVTAFTAQAVSPKQIERYQKEGDADVKWVDKILHDPTSLSGDKASSVLPQLQEALKTETDPARVAKLTSAISAATQARNNYFADTQRKATADQIAKQGDSAAAGKALVAGDLTLADLKTRGTTADFILNATAEAKKLDPTYNPADEVNFEHIAKSPQAAQFFGSARSLLEKGGSLDQLMDWGKKIPNNKLPALNSVEDWQKLAAGKGPLAGYAALVLGVADDYGKVMGGGAASDHARDSALNLFAAAQTQEQRLAAIQGTLGGVGSQYHARVGNNKFLKREYDNFERSPLTQTQQPQSHNQPNAAPNTHMFDPTAWQKAHPGQDVNAAIAYAKSQGYQVKQ